MIKGYHRPKNKIEAITLFRRTTVQSIFLSGSSRFGNFYDQDVEVIDLQDIKLDSADLAADEEGNINCLEYLDKVSQTAQLTPELKQAIMHDFTENQRNSTPLAGLLFHATGNSLTSCICLAADATVILFVNEEKMEYGDWILQRTKRELEVCEKIKIPPSVHIGIDWISKSPADYPELIVALATWQSGRTRLVIGNSGNGSPQVVFDGTEKQGIEQAARNACSHLFTTTIDKQFYLTETSMILIQRLLLSHHSAQ